ncbi:MAG: hypothetical protein PHQ27_03165 [Victivallales bacterium]|nr:hypothetical protein [Victivallales bacterium]
MNFRYGSRRFYCLMFIAVVLLTFGIRSLVYYREAAVIKKITGTDFVPFMVESAIMYGYAQDVAAGKSIAGCDADIGGGLDRVPVADQMLLGLEYFLGWSYRIKTFFTGRPQLSPGATDYEDNPDFTAFARMEIRAWISLVGGLIFLWLILMRVPWLWATVAGLWYAVSPAAIARYTGQDLVRGEFAMPFIIGCLMLMAWIMRRPAGFKYVLLGLCTMASFAFLDAPQFFFTFWAGLELLRLLLGGRTTTKRRSAWLAIYVGTVLAALLVPYQRYHGLLASPVVIVVIPLLLTIMFAGNRLTLRRRLIWCGGGAAALLIIWKLLPGYGRNYSHFGRLIRDKLLFGNVKPTDPTLLGFDSRILWTPAMHSADWISTWFYYPAMLWVMGLFVLLLCCSHRTRQALLRGLPRSYQIFALAVIFTGMYVFFVRAHVFSIIFLCLGLALLLDAWWRVRRQYGWKNLRTIIPAVLLALALAAELGMTFLLGRAYARNYFKETAGMIRWFRDSNLHGVTILTDMNLSPVLKAYCGARIITQPKFELKTTRDILHDYLMHLYHHNEKEFAAMCEKLGVSLVVFDRGNSYAVPMHIYSARYIADAKKIKRYAPAWIMEKHPGTMRYFHPVPPPPGMEYISKSYYVFRFVSDEQRRKAEKSAELAQYFYYSGKIALARKMARAAYAMAPNLDRSYLAYYKVFGKIPNDSLIYLGQMQREATEKQSDGIR